MTSSVNDDYAPKTNCLRHNMKLKLSNCDDVLPVAACLLAQGVTGMSANRASEACYALSMRATAARLASFATLWAKPTCTAGLRHGSQLHTSSCRQQANRSLLAALIPRAFAKEVQVQEGDLRGSLHKLAFWLSLPTAHMELPLVNNIQQRPPTSKKTVTTKHT